MKKILGALLVALVTATVQEVRAHLDFREELRVRERGHQREQAYILKWAECEARHETSRPP